MNDPQSGKDYLEELRDFLAFLKKLWGVLAGISVFFPLSNIVVQAIPMGSHGVNDGVFDQLAPALITTIATVVTFFVALVTFSGRNELRQKGTRRTVLRNAWCSLGTGLLSLLAYLILHQIYREYAWEPWGWGSGDPRKLIAEIPLLVSYVIFFSSLTRAFMLLGMIEFFGQGHVRDT